MLRRCVVLGLGLALAVGACSRPAGKGHSDHSAGAIDASSATSHIARAPLPPTRPEPVEVSKEPAGNEPDRPYKFTLQGRPYVPLRVYSRRGLPDRLAPGDVVVVAGFPFVLGEERVLGLIVEEHEGERRMLLVDSTRARRLVGLEVKDTYLVNGEDRPIRVNAISRLSPAELRGLRGVSLRAWPSSVESKLAQLDHQSSCVFVNHEVLSGAIERFPALPEPLRCLIVDGDGRGSGLRGKASLSTLRELEVLALDNVAVGKDEPALDLSRILSCRKARVLHLTSSTLTGYEALKDCTEVRDLDLSGSEQLASLSFVAGMMQLRRVAFRRSGVASLEPLNGLRFLEVVDAGASRVSSLPAGGLVSLKRLALFGTPVPAAQVRKFQAEHPGCALELGLIAKLRSVAAVVDRVRVREGGTRGHHSLEYSHELDPHTVFELRGRADVTELLSAVDASEAKTYPVCECCSELSLELFQGERQLAVISITVGGVFNPLVKWPGVWPGGAFLTEESQKRLAAILIKRGYQPRK